MGTGRTAKVIITAEAKVLRQLRVKHGLSMKQAGALMDYSDSYISQIENGRENPPKAERLLKFLNAYGKISEKYFRELVREIEKDLSDVDVIEELLPKLKPAQLRAVRVLCESLAAAKL
jgi:transcriptional regulator with XRE-family HTH domain